MSLRTFNYTLCDQSQYLNNQPKGKIKQEKVKVYANN